MQTDVQMREGGREGICGRMYKWREGGHMQTDVQMEGGRAHVDGCTNRGREGTCGRMYKWRKGGHMQTDVQMEGGREQGMDRPTDGKTDKWMDGRVDKWTN